MLTNARLYSVYFQALAPMLTELIYFDIEFVHNSVQQRYITRPQS